jgi:nicotinate phosphoribosyltransferase
MPGPTDLYGQSLALLTDLYQLTMAYAAFRAGIHDREAVFNLHFRKNPFGGGYSVACGVDSAVDYISRWKTDESDLAYLATLRGSDGAPLFAPDFLAYLGGLRMEVDVDAVPEGTVVFPREPLVRVRGPIIPCMLLETPLLTLVNFQTLVATKAARLCWATRGEPVVEFGLRRAQGIDGALSASRAAYVGGVHGTSNVMAAKLFGLPVRGTHAHSWVMLFDDERQAFTTYADALPNNCVFLVDTYDTLDGVRHAVEVGHRLRASGHQLLGVRLDSGDLAFLSQEARKILDQGGFPDAQILATNDLDERLIESLKQQGAKVNAWGVGTKLATCFDEPALGGVYKLGAVRAPREPWKHRVKISEQTVKTSIPGILQVRRFRGDSGWVCDALYDVDDGAPAAGSVMIDPLDPTRQKRLPVEGEAAASDLLRPMVRAGRALGEPPPLEEARRRARAELDGFHEGIKRFMNPHTYPVGLARTLYDRRTALILEHRGLS